MEGSPSLLYTKWPLCLAEDLFWQVCLVPHCMGLA